MNNKFDEIYKDLLKNILDNGIEELNERTGHKTKALPGLTFQIDIEKDGFPLLALRKLHFSFIPEIMWMLSGSNDLNWLSKHTKIWNFFAEEDNTVTSAYGFRWRHHFKIDQLSIVIDKLKKDPSNRHGVIMMWSPLEDLTIKQKNVPCPFSYHLSILGGRLHLHLIIRSNDMILGNPTDVAGFAFLQHIIAQELNVRPGILTVSISNAHVYDNHYEIAKILTIRSSHQKLIKIDLPKDCYKRACSLDDTLIKEVKDLFFNYQPLEAITNIPIAL